MAYQGVQAVRHKSIKYPAKFEGGVDVDIYFALEHIDGMRYRPKATTTDGKPIEFNGPLIPVGSWPGLIGAAARQYVEANDLPQFYAVNWSDGPIVMLQRPIPISERRARYSFVG